MIPSGDISEDEAKALYDSKWWEGKPARDVALAQLQQARLCMPFGDFHKACEEAAGVPIWTHEFVRPEYVRSLIESGKRDASPLETLDAILLNKGERS